MKKLLKVVAIFASFALLFGTLSCSSDDDSDGSGPNNPVSGSGSGGSTGGDTTGGDSTGGETVNAVWDFTKWTAELAMDATGTTITPTSGAGATLVGKSGAATNDNKIKEVDGVYCLAVGKQTGTIAEYATKSKGIVELTLSKATDVTMNCCASGSTDLANRWYVITKADGTVLAQYTFESDENPLVRRDVTFTDVPAGKYTIHMDGFRIYKLTTGKIDASSFNGGTYEFTESDIAKIKLAGDITSITSSDTEVITVAEDFSSITALKAGTATLTITDGTYNATVLVSVDATGSISLGTPVNPFILKTEEKTLDVSDCGLTTISSATMETGKGTASISEKTLTYSVAGFTAAGTAKITLSDGTNEAEVTVTVDALGDVRAAITKPYVPAGTKVTYKLPLELSGLGLTGDAVQWTSQTEYSQIGSSIFYGFNVKNENWKPTAYSEGCGMTEAAGTYSWSATGGKLAKSTFKNGIKVTTTGPATVKWWVANVTGQSAPVPGVYDTSDTSDTSKLVAATITDLKRNGASVDSFAALGSGSSDATTVYLYEFTISAAGIYAFGDATTGKMYTAGLEITF